jgi:hypothetical protein
MKKVKNLELRVKSYARGCFATSLLINCWGNMMKKWREIKEIKEREEERGICERSELKIKLLTLNSKLLTSFLKLLTLNSKLLTFKSLYSLILGT